MSSAPIETPMGGDPKPPATDIEAAVLRDGVRELYAHRPQALAICIVMLPVFSWMFVSRVDPWLLGLWITMMVAMTANGIYWLRDFRRIARQTTWDARRHLRLYSLQSWFAGGVFGLMGWLFYHPDFGELRWAVVLWLCALSAGTVTVYAHHFPTYLGFVVLLSAPLTLRFVYSGAPGGWVAYGLLFFYVVMLIKFAQRQGRQLTQALRVRHENAALLVQLEQKTLALEQALESKARFFAAASHDLRQPLQALGYYSTLLQPHAQDAPLVERIQQCVDALDGLLEGVLSISRLEAGKVQVQRAAVDLPQLLSRLLAQYQGMALSKGLTLRLLMSKRASSWVDTDPLLLERVVGNLLHNALRYTLHGGVLLAVRPCCGATQLRVIDTGLGIAAADQGGIFDEFLQLNNPQRDATQGVGLGLATVKRLCALLEHPLAVRSRVGQGSAFSLQLPACAAPEPSLALAPRPVDNLLQGRVMVVEDNQLVREALQGTLQRWGLACDVFADGTSAMAQAHLQRYDAAISDWRLPGELNGIEVLAQLRALQPTLTVAILLTGELQAEAAPLQAGIHLLQKPLRPLRLRALLSAHLSAA